MTTFTDVRFDSGGLSLAGTLHRPEGGGPHPALVMLQGSGPTDRDSGGYFPPLRERFLATGLAVLSWDKPGIGGSTGDWRGRTLFDRATEALVVREWLRAQAGIDPARVGIWGHSQGAGSGRWRRRRPPISPSWSSTRARRSRYRSRMSTGSSTPCGATGMTRS